MLGALKGRWGTTRCLQAGVSDAWLWSFVLQLICIMLDLLNWQIQQIPRICRTKWSDTVMWSSFIPWMTDKSVHLPFVAFGWLVLYVKLAFYSADLLAVCLFHLASDEHWLEHNRICFIRFWFEGPQACQRVCFLCVCVCVCVCALKKKKKFWYEVFGFGDLFYFVELFRNAVSDWFSRVLSHLFSRVDETFREIISDVWCLFQCVSLGMCECCFMFVCVTSIPLNFRI